MKSFTNGRALGGHMRSHMIVFPLPPKAERFTEPASSISCAASSSEEEEDETSLTYKLRENPKKSVRLVDPEFSFASASASIILQDRESETESSKNPTRRRSKRNRRMVMLQRPSNEHTDELNRELEMKRIKSYQLSKTESVIEHEPVSSISDTTPEEDVAFCLMMLSRDKWWKEKHEAAEQDQGDEEDEEEEEEEEESKFSKRSRGKFKCETCSKVFRSYQALGGHRASHKKNKVNSSSNQYQKNEAGNLNTITAGEGDQKKHECPVCLRIFSSGQALGGHKRSHVTSSSAKFGNNLIDLNLPAPLEDDEISQIELSAVSDAEFIKFKEIKTCRTEDN